MGERRRLVWETYGDLGIARSREVTTPEKVLAEMGVERGWRCAATQRLQDRPCDNRNGQCGWVWIVKEAEDG